MRQTRAESRLEKEEEVKIRWNSTLTTQRRTLAMKESKVNRKDKAIGGTEEGPRLSRRLDKSSSDQTLEKTMRTTRQNFSSSSLRNSKRYS